MIDKPLELTPGIGARDGAVASAYAIPDDQDPDKIIRVSITEYLIPSEIAMPFKPWFHFWNAWFPPNAKRSSELFTMGYRSARQKHELFLEKGFTPLDKPEQNGLSKHRKQFELIASTATNFRSLQRAPHNSEPQLLDEHDYDRVERKKSTVIKGDALRPSRSVVSMWMNPIASQSSLQTSSQGSGNDLAETPVTQRQRRKSKEIEDFTERQGTDIGRFCKNVDERDNIDRG